MPQQSEEYKGHRIELHVPQAEEISIHEDDLETARDVGKETRAELLIDDAPVEYGQLPDGKYFLREYAYDWRDDLLDLARGYIDYRIESGKTGTDDQPVSGGDNQSKEEK